MNYSEIDKLIVKHITKDLNLREAMSFVHFNIGSVPRYSREIDHAYKILDFFGGYSISRESANGDVTVNLTPLDSDKSYEYTAKTASLAISLCALESKSVDLTEQ